MNFGHCRLSLSIGGLLVREHMHAAHERIAPHVHAEPYVCVVMAGAYSEATRSRTLQAQAGTVLGHGAGAEHANAFGAQGGICLNVTPETAWREDGCWRDWFGAQAPAARADGRALARLRRELAAPDPLRPFGVAAAIFDLLHGAAPARAPGGVPSWLADLRERIDAAPGEPVSLGGFARAAGVHPSHLARAFRAWTGQTLGEYARARRLDAAIDMIRHEAAPLAEIAARCGFADQAHLTRAVKAATGRTPRAFKNASRIQ
ncbi:MAG TPA: AraC family transcriptional regulator [Telluria sp.]|nr:AraC family transcriptional regulator [Telluria sp.]